MTTQAVGFAKKLAKPTACIFHLGKIRLKLAVYLPALIEDSVKQVQFYLLSQTDDGELTAAEALACDLAAQLWRQGKRVILSCETEQQALKLDEALWVRDADNFVPHNLSGEVTTYATPIEIAWKGKRNAQRRDVLITLQTELPEFINSFNHIIDFVPVEDTAKAQARERYKQYRQLGWQLGTEQR